MAVYLTLMAGLAGSGGIYKLSLRLNITNKRSLAICQSLKWREQKQQQLTEENGIFPELMFYELPFQANKQMRKIIHI